MDVFLIIIVSFCSYLYHFSSYRKEVVSENTLNSEWEYIWHNYCDALHHATAELIEEFKSGLSIDEAKARLNNQYRFNHEFTLQTLLNVSTTPIEEWEGIPDRILDRCFLYPIPKNLKDIPSFDKDTKTLKSVLIRDV